MAHVKVWSSSGLLVKSDYRHVRQLTCSFLIAEPSLLKCSSFAAFTLKSHFLWGLILRGSETSEGETRERCFLGAASATPAGAGLMPQVEAVPNAEAMDWWDYCKKFEGLHQHSAIRDRDER